MHSASQLLWIEFLLKGAAGLLLFLAPLTSIRILGLPATPTGFWVRLLGALLIGIAVASALEGARYTVHGLGLAGALAINLTAASALSTMLLSDPTALKARGRSLLWLLAAVLAVLSFAQAVTLTMP